MVFKPSEHCVVIFRLLLYTQIDCVGVDKRVSMRSPLRRRISDRPISMRIIWCRISFWIRVCGRKNITSMHFRENRYFKICVGGFGKFLFAKKLSSNSDSQYMHIALVWSTYESKIKVFQKWAMTHISRPQLVFENLKSRDVFIFDENDDELQKNIQSFGFVSTKLEWRLKRHLSLEGYTFISVPRELSNIHCINTVY